MAANLKSNRKRICKVLLLVPPLKSTKSPMLSLHLLQAVCRQVGVSSYVLYTNLPYSVITGPFIHNKLSDPCHMFGENLFAAAAFDRPNVSGYMEKILSYNWLSDLMGKTYPDMAKQFYKEIEPHFDWFYKIDWEDLEYRTFRWIQSIAQRIANMMYPVVGCSTTLGGLIPAVALLNSIKKENPNIITVLGGALCEGEMAEGILSLKVGIDYVFSGEGEITFPDFIRKVLAGNLPEGKIIYGEPVMDLNTIPLPDYRDYLEQLEKLSPSYRPSPENIRLSYETSRGCWYGKCTFCSLNGEKNFYRKKSTEKVLEDFKALIGKHGNYTVIMTDTIMPLDYIDTLFPRIAEEVSSLQIAYEIKANLTMEQMLSFKQAGVIKVQAGIESLSSSLLKRMRKGVTAGGNIALLRCSRSINLSLSWNLLFGFPGDVVEEYEEMLRLFPLIHHLPPPSSVIPMLILRFSPYQRSPSAFGIFNLRPAKIYQDIFPSHANLGKIACYFNGDFSAQSYEHLEMIVALIREVQAWKKSWAAYEKVPLDMMLPTLHITQKTGDEYVLEDTRGLPGRPKRIVLNREQASILLVPRPQKSFGDYKWAVDAKLGVLMCSWFIPLATAEPKLLMEFEQDYKSDD